MIEFSCRSRFIYRSLTISAFFASDNLFQFHEVGLTVIPRMRSESLLNVVSVMWSISCRLRWNLWVWNGKSGSIDGFIGILFLQVAVTPCLIRCIKPRVTQYYSNGIFILRFLLFRKSKILGFLPRWFVRIGIRYSFNLFGTTILV